MERGRRMLEYGGAQSFGQAISIRPGERLAVANKEGDDFDSQLMTVQLGVSLEAPSQTPDFDVWDLVAHLGWGVGGTSEKAEIDCLLGTAVTLAATSVTVDISYPSVLGPVMRVTAMLAYGALASGYARRTIAMGQVDAGDTAVIDVPRWAQSVVLLSDDPAGYGGYIVELERATNNIALGAIPLSAFERDAIPMPAAARRLRVINQAVDAARLSALFTLRFS